MRSEVHSIRWVVVTNEGEFLVKLQSDWGPGYMTTAKLEEATLFDSPNHAESVSKNEWAREPGMATVRQVELIEHRRLL